MALTGRPTLADIDRGVLFDARDGGGVAGFIPPHPYPSNG